MKLTAVCYFFPPPHPLIRGTAYTYINLPWLPSGADSAALQENAWQAVRDILTRAVLSYGRETSKGVLLTDNASLLKALQSLGPSIFRASKGGTANAVALLDWLSDRVSPPLPGWRVHLT